MFPCPYRHSCPSFSTAWSRCIELIFLIAFSETTESPVPGTSPVAPAYPHPPSQDTSSRQARPHLGKGDGRPKKKKNPPKKKVQGRVRGSWWGPGRKVETQTSTFFSRRYRIGTWISKPKRKQSHVTETKRPTCSVFLGLPDCLISPEARPPQVSRTHQVVVGCFLERRSVPAHLHNMSSCARPHSQRMHKRSGSHLFVEGGPREQRHASQVTNSTSHGPWPRSCNTTYAAETKHNAKPSTIAAARTARLHGQLATR
ncbi:hypothetical protein B0J12DRAFT_11827 [Macrophomina phaseolina]|uniref:Secreted protein n=1 Tax=Macrophomina phaseolina TaxID=35725 RepID=A0ABQ8GU43_9PEZI|nr:hypothetical protein B0J12DRAFT_11827 [Macrophomina phaseolina]